MADESVQSSYPLTYAVMRSLDRWRDCSTIEALIKDDPDGSAAEAETIFRWLFVELRVPPGWTEDEMALFRARMVVSALLDEAFSVIERVTKVRAVYALLIPTTDPHSPVWLWSYDCHDTYLQRSKALVAPSRLSFQGLDMAAIESVLQEVYAPILELVADTEGLDSMEQALAHVLVDG